MHDNRRNLSLAVDMILVALAIYMISRLLAT